MIQKDILAILKKINPYVKISAESRLIEDGILDSLTLLFFVEELEKNFSLKIPEDELKPENFASISAVVKLLQRIHS